MVETHSPAGVGPKETHSPFFIETGSESEGGKCAGEAGVATEGPVSPRRLTAFGARGDGLGEGLGVIS